LGIHRCADDPVNRLANVPVSADSKPDIEIDVQNYMGQHEEVFQLDNES